MTMTTRLHTFFFGKEVGADQFGNRYFTEKSAAKGRRTKRWVVYNGRAEPSKVPAEWHGWLHYTLDTTPDERGVMHHEWEKPSLPNLTGTQNAYVPPGHINKGGNRAPNTSDYEPWKP